MTRESLRHIRYRYGMFPEHYQALYDSQEGRCAACGEEGRGGGQGNANARLFVDHDHGTGAIRGLLCQGCNAAIGLAYDSPQTLRALAEYLERPPAYVQSDFPPRDRGIHARSKTHCPQGHPYDEENTYVVPKSRVRQCRICRREADRRRYPRTKKVTP